MSDAKIRLSAKEAELINDAGIILTKNGIIRKVIDLFGELAGKQVDYLQRPGVPGNASSIPPKISRGENYKGLPYVMLDHPRIFEKEDVLAIRTFFWWGNFFSVTLHLAGTYKKQFEKNIRARYDDLTGGQFYCCFNDDPWDHDLTTNHYKNFFGDITPGEFDNLLAKKTFLKIAARVELRDWDNAEGLLLEKFSQLQQLLSHHPFID